MALTDSEKQRTRTALGYLGSGSVGASIQLGIPRLAQTGFLVELAMDNLLPESEPILRNYLMVIDGINNRLVAAQKRLAAADIGDIKLNPQECDQLEKEYVRWAYRISDLLGAPVNMNSQRFMSTGCNIPVRNC